jgi:hypothetical protein
MTAQSYLTPVVSNTAYFHCALGCLLGSEAAGVKGTARRTIPEALPSRGQNALNSRPGYNAGHALPYMDGRLSNERGGLPTGGL